MRLKCKAQTKLGAPCSRPALRGSKRCTMHTPGRAEEIGRAGGLRRRVFSPDNLAPLETCESAQDVTRFIAVTMNEVRLAKLDPRIANALGQLGTVFLKALELGNVEQRLAALEARHQELQDMKHRRG